MKTLVLAAAMAFGIWCGSLVAQTPTNNALALVKCYNGVCVYVYAVPANDYTTVGVITKRVVANTATEAIEKYAAMAKQLYPFCNGIILPGIQTGFNRDTITVIQF